MATYSETKQIDEIPVVAARGEPVNLPEGRGENNSLRPTKVAALRERMKRRMSSIWDTMMEWSDYQDEIKDYPNKVSGNHQRVEQAFMDYRYSLVDLSHKHRNTDAEILNRFTELQQEYPVVRKETRRRPLFTRSLSDLSNLRMRWQKLVVDQDKLVDFLEKSQDTQHAYNSTRIRQKQELEEQQVRRDNQSKIDAAYSVLESTVHDVSSRMSDGEAISIGTRILRIEDAQESWTNRLEVIRQTESAQSIPVQETLVSLKKLEDSVRETPASARWIQSVEIRFAKIISRHDLLVSLGRNMIPSAELARVTTLLYEELPNLWLQGDHEKITSYIQAVEKFIEYYGGVTERELDMVERQRPGITRALNTPVIRQGSEDLTQMIILARSMMYAIDSRDRFMRGHSEYVTRISLGIARFLNWKEVDLQYLEMAALLHDVGKLAIPETILTKVQPLTLDEREIIERHPAYGANILRPVENLTKIVPWVYHHQERWDGRGYPDGLAKKDIPLGAQIISLAEAYSAMLIDTPYRPAFTPDIAQQRLKKERERHFHPEVVDAFMENIRIGPQLLPQDVYEE